MQPLPPPRGQASPANTNTSGQNKQSSRSSGVAQAQVQAVENTQASNNPAQTSSKPKKRKHRGGKKRRNRRQSFAAPPSDVSGMLSNPEDVPDDPSIDITEERTAPRPPDSFYLRRANRSNDSLNSDVLFDHRNTPAIRPRRESKLNVVAAHRAGLAASLGRQHSGHSSHSREGLHNRRRTKTHSVEDSDHDDPTDRTPLIGNGSQRKSPVLQTSYNVFKTNTRGSSRSSRDRNPGSAPTSFPKYQDDSGYDVNNPPSVPTSPQLLSHFDDPMIPEGDFLTRSPDSSRNLKAQNRDALIDVDAGEEGRDDVNSTLPSPDLRNETLHRARTVTLPVQGDVCFPSEVMSELGEEDFERLMSREESTYTRRRRRKREWPQLWVLDDWSREEKEERAAGERRAQKIREPVMIEGRLRPSRQPLWHRTEEDVPFRYTYFNEEFESTIHAQTISELVQPGSSFRELFIPDRPILEDSSESETDSEPEPEEKVDSSGILSPKSQSKEAGPSQTNSRLNSFISQPAPDSQAKDLNGKPSNQGSRERSSPQTGSLAKMSKPRKLGPRPTFWLDVLCPTDQEMRVLSKAFGIHALTAEDIMMQEAREKVELFKNYYFINYRTFEQDTNDEDYLEPINMYVIVFRHGILTFHFSQIPHPANVRRRIRQLTDYLILSSDWISYAIIDDITDVYQPLIHNIEREVDDIDELILRAFPGGGELKGDDSSSMSGEAFSGIDMLRRVGECRKKVMSLYRLLGNKADVIKGFAKRCNEQWDVAPKSEIGLYLGDIQDHILTMTSNLSHYETLLSRAHSNYLAQVSIRMNERQEQTSDILNKLTVLGTIVLPMNIICGMWGMNVKVPGQEIDNLWWFWGITAGLILFAVSCFLWCKRVYGIV